MMYLCLDRKVDNIKSDVVKLFLAPFRDLSVQSMIRVDNSLVTWDARHTGEEGDEWRVRVRVSPLNQGECHEDKTIMYEQASKLNDLIDRIRPIADLIPRVKDTGYKAEFDALLENAKTASQDVSAPVSIVRE